MDKFDKYLKYQITISKVANLKNSKLHKWNIVKWKKLREKRENMKIMCIASAQFQYSIESSLLQSIESSFESV